MDSKKVSFVIGFYLTLSYPILAQEPLTFSWESTVFNKANGLSNSEVIESLEASSKSLWAPVATPQMMQVDDGVGDLGWIVSDYKDTVLFKVCDQEKLIKLERKLLKKTDKTCDDGVPTIVGRVDKLDSQSLANMIQDSFCGGYNGTFVNGRERMAVL